MRALSVAVLVGLVAVAGVARADVHTSKAGKVSIDIPKKWSVNETDELIRAASPDNQVAFVFWVIDSADVKPALTKLEGELYSSVQGLRWVDKVQKVKVNSLPGSVVQGVGVNAAANQLDLLVTIAGPTKTKKGVILLAVVEHDKLKANRPTIQSIFQTLKSTK
jgi:hypothetical protein